MSSNQDTQDVSRMPHAPVPNRDDDKPEVEYTCPVCNDEFGDYDGCYDHIEDEHGDAAPRFSGDEIP